MLTSEQFLSVCRHCKAWCCTLVRPSVTEHEKLAILAVGFNDYFTKIDDDIYIIKPDSNGICPYLKDDYSCKIHQVKPKLCKIWPVIPRYKNGKRDYVVIKCPLFPQLSKEKLEQAKKEAETISTLIIQHLWDISPETKQKYKRFEYEEI